MSFDLTPSEDLRQILGAGQAMLEAHYPVARLRDPARSDPVAPLAEFGAFVLALPEDQGGAGFTLVEEAHLHVALGRHLVAPSAIAHAVAARIALVQGDAERAHRIAAAEIRVCAGVAGRDGWLLFEPMGAQLALIRDGDGFRLADLEGIAPEAVTAMGHGRPLAHAKAPDGAGRPVGGPHAGVAALLVSAQLLGVASAARDLAVAYAGVREQFGRPIGSFQAVKHHAANMAIGVEMLSAQLDMAAIALRDAEGDAPFQIAALARLAPRVALETARAGIQIHGAIGFSAEADAHLYVKQAHLLAQLLGRADLMSHAAPLTPTPQPSI